MAPSFLNLKELRRRSRASFRTERSTDTSSNSDQQNYDTTPTTGSITPPSLSAQSDPGLNLHKDQSPSQAPPVPPRPPVQPNNSNRYSVSGMTGIGSPVLSGRSSLPVSQYAPRIANINDNAWVCSIFAQLSWIFYSNLGLVLDKVSYRLDIGIATYQPYRRNSYALCPYYSSS